MSRAAARPPVQAAGALAWGSALRARAARAGMRAGADTGGAPEGHTTRLAWRTCPREW